MSCTIEKILVMWEEGSGVSVVQEPSAACCVGGQSVGLVSVSGIETIDWLLWSTDELCEPMLSS